jgi:3-hydroxybutyryl-CoA dehydratase
LCGATTIRNRIRLMKNGGTNGKQWPLYYFEDLKVGMEASHAKRITESDIQSFADISGDDNPVHLCDEYASGTIFKQRIAHGILTASLVSTVIGTKLPGPGAIYVSQSLNFRAPVRIDDEVIAVARITDLLPEKSRVIFACNCDVDGKTVLDGEAVILVPNRPV